MQKPQVLQCSLHSAPHGTHLAACSGCPPPFRKQNEYEAGCQLRLVFLKKGEKAGRQPEVIAVTG